MASFCVPYSNLVNLSTIHFEDEDNLTNQEEGSTIIFNVGEEGRLSEVGKVEGVEVSLGEVGNVEDVEGPDKEDEMEFFKISHKCKNTGCDSFFKHKSSMIRHTIICSKGPEWAGLECSICKVFVR